ncbi:hypothetical protein NMG60_11015504 [Bertholletia excelsa]
MYRSKLQELCHKNKWGLPNYSCIKDGPDHSPQFRASVSVNGISFLTPTISVSSKAALHQAAELAFLHFTSSDVRSIPEGPEIEETHMNVQLDSNASDVVTDTKYQYKMQLVRFVERKNLGFPMYNTKRDGPSHAPRFHAAVTIGGQSFESAGFFRTSKEAEHAAAKIDAHLYKNFLQELAQNEGFTMPVYCTTECGPRHKLTYFSTVKIQGEIFRGKGEKSKKLAEQSAAKVAYTAFMERNSRSISSRDGNVTSNGLTPNSDLPTTNVHREQSLPLCSTREFEEHSKGNEDEDEGLACTEFSLVDAKDNLMDSTAASSALIGVDEINGSGNSCPLFGSLPASPKGEASSAETTLPELADLSICASNTRKRDDTRSSYLLCNRVRVYTCFPEIEFPKGTVVLPIDNSKWVAVSLEFPEEFVI